MLAAGRRLGPYEIIAPLGSGGMGEVYRARDTRLGRDIAIKILSEDVAVDSERLLRFEQEGRAASALNHPNILTIFDIGTADGTPYVVTELLEGETLGSQINGTALPLRKTIDYATQIARGLAAAHGRGIVHRDLKPDNVFVTADGRIKILDFGLAKVTDAAPTVTGVTAMPTAMPNTLPGVVLGTIGYMSPEQVRGHTADHRSDIFAFGAILYEMLTGRRAFSGDSAIESMSAILKEHPPELSASGKAIPPALERIVHHSLEKRPEQRFQSASDIAFALEALSGASEAMPSRGESDGRATSAARRDSALIWKLIAAMASAIAVVALVIAVLHSRSGPPAMQPVRFTLDVPEDTTLPATGTPSIAVSPDGHAVAFIAQSKAGVPEIWVRPLDELSAHALPGTAGVNFGEQGILFWSPDSKTIAFVAGNKLKKVDLAGSSAQTLADIPASTNVYWGGTWSTEGTILVGSSTGILRAAASGGELVPVIKRNDAAQLVYPRFLTDGRRFVFARIGGERSRSGVYLGSLDSGDTRRLTADPGQLSIASGFLLFWRAGSLMAEPFDSNRAEVTGAARQLANSVAGYTVTGRAAYAVSENGVLAFYSGTGQQMTQFTLFDRNGSERKTFGLSGRHQTMAVSPDGRRVVYGRSDVNGTQNLWVMDLIRGVATRLTFGANRDSDGTWSPDGSRIAYSSVREGLKSLFEVPSSGGPERLLLKSEGSPLSMDAWSPDGRVVLYHLEVDRELRALPLEGDRKTFLVVHPASGRVDEPSFSPDGRWLAYNSDESGQFEVYAIPFPPTAAKWQLSASGGGQPRWRGDGRELYYLAPDGTMMAVDIKAGTAIEPGTPHALFKTNVTPNFTSDQYAVSGDGQGFVIMNPVGPANATPITVVLDWPALLSPPR